MNGQQLLDWLKKQSPEVLAQPIVYCTSKANLKTIAGVRELTDEDTAWIEKGAAEGSTVLFTYKVD